MDALLNFGSVIVGGVITWFFSRWYYLAASKDLSKEAKELRRLTNMLLMGLNNSNMIDVTWDQKTGKPDAVRITSSFDTLRVVQNAGRDQDAPGSYQEGTRMSVTDELLSRNESYAEGFEAADLPAPPGKRVAVVTCMDARLNVYGILGLSEGEAHVIRNAGGVVTDDVIRSLTISQRFLGTQEIMLVHHTDCGMLTFSDDEAKQLIQEETGIRPAFAMEAFSDLEEDVRQSIRRVQASPFIPNKDAVRGFVYEVETGRLHEFS